MLFITAKHCIHSQQWRGQALFSVRCALWYEQWAFQGSVPQVQLYSCAGIASDEMVVAVYLLSPGSQDCTQSAEEHLRVQAVPAKFT